MQGVDIFKQEVERCKNEQRKVLLYGDPDPDGLFSLKLLIDFAEMLDLDYTYYVNPKRQHGFFLDNVEKYKDYLIISADFTIEPDEIEDIVNQGITILATDHHSYNHAFVDYVANNNRGIMINNQYPFEDKEDKYLSGAGVFYELACEAYPEFKSKEREALVGITLITDARALENEKARKYLRTTYSADTSNASYLNYLVNGISDEDFGFGTKKLDRSFIEYTLSPTLNALLRADKLNEAIDFILGKGLANKNVRAKQRELINDMIASAKVTTILSTDFIALDIVNLKKHYPNVDFSNYVGVTCSKYMNLHNQNSSICFIIDEDDKGVRSIGRCSFRPRYQDLAYLSELRSIGIVDAKGHETAFGIVNFQKYATPDWFNKIACAIYTLETDYVDKRTVLDVQNLNIWHLTKGVNVATENSYVRSFLSTYIKYRGNLDNVITTSGPKILVEKFTQQDYADQLKPDSIIDGIYYKYKRRPDGKYAIKFVSYLVDGITVKSLNGLYIDDPDVVIIPVLNKGYVEYHLTQIK